MSDSPVSLLAGATGAVGTQLLELLLARADGTRVIAVGRGAAPLAHPRLHWIRAGLDELGPALASVHATEAFCCLGTTLQRAGSRAAFRAVDLDGVAAFAAAAHAAGAGFFALVSAAGAHPRARNFYLRTKGEAEAAVEALGFRSLAILQPGLLRGPRREFRLGERIGQVAAPVADRLMMGPLARYRSVRIETVARAMDAAAREARRGTARLTPRDMEALAHAG